MNGTDCKPRIIECSRCGCEWNISSQAHIPETGYICPHCTSRERENNAFQEDKHMANRSLLHRSKIEDFKSWLQEDGWEEAEEIIKGRGNKGATTKCVGIRN